MATLTIPGQWQAMGSAMQQQMANPAYYNLVDSLTTTGDTLGWSNTTTADVHIQGNVYANAFQTWGQQACRKIIKFFRVNELVEVPEGVVVEPLDELRIKVMRWLDGAKVTV